MSDDRGGAVLLMRAVLFVFRAFFFAFCGSFVCVLHCTAFAYGGDGWGVKGSTSPDGAPGALDVEDAEAQRVLELQGGVPVSLGFTL